MVMERESALLAEEFAETCRQEGIAPQQRTLHADNGSLSRPVYFWLMHTLDTAVELLPGVLGLSAPAHVV